MLKTIVNIYHKYFCTVTAGVHFIVGIPKLSTGGAEGRGGRKKAVYASRTPMRTKRVENRYWER